ncbi:MAG: hypothetical protein M1813_007301 [Trichoglossum hirsutum]|nr:MAG: hypothetical protein M1813_007301 [Trichoglossum hirsutum]
MYKRGTGLAHFFSANGPAQTPVDNEVHIDHGASSQLLITVPSIIASSPIYMKNTIGTESFYYLILLHRVSTSNNGFRELDIRKRYRSGLTRIKGIIKFGSVRENRSVSQAAGQSTPLVIGPVPGDGANTGDSRRSSSILSGPDNGKTNGLLGGCRIVITPNLRIAPGLRMVKSASGPSINTSSNLPGKHSDGSISVGSIDLEVASG